MAITVLLSLLLVQGPTRPASPPGTPVQAANGTAVVEGLIVRAGDASPLAKARVTLTRTDARNRSTSVTTDAAGKFLFSGLDAGSYRLTATRNGYSRAEYGQRTPGRAGTILAVGPGQRLADLSVTLYPAATITGRVLDQDGEPVVNANVQALRSVFREGERTLENVQQARTNDLGEYRLFWMMPGQYYVSVTYQGSGAGPGPMAGPGFRPGNADAESEDRYAPTYYPGTLDVAGASAVKLDPGTVYSGVDFLLNPVRTVRVSGRVLDGSSGQAAGRAQVMLLPGRRQPGMLRQGLNSRSATDADGRFELHGVVPGAYTLVAIQGNAGGPQGTAPGQGRGRRGRPVATLRMDVGAANVDNVSLVLSEGLNLSGRVYIEGLDPVQGLASIARNADRAAAAPDPRTANSGVNVRLRPRDAVFGEIGGGGLNAGILLNGSFTLEGVPPGDYRLTVNGMPPGYFVKAARLGGKNILDDGLTVENTSSGSVDILISPNSGQIDGSVVDDEQKPVAGSIVALVPDNPRMDRADLFRTATPDQYGRFSLTGIPPGTYRLFAFEELEPGAHQDPDFIAAFENRAATVRVDERGRQTVQIKRIRIDAQP